MAPGMVTAELGPKIESLRVMVEDLKTSLACAGGKKQSVDVSTLVSSKRMEKLSRSAQRVLCSATTVYSQSEWGGSVFGEVLDDLTRERTLDWITEPLFETDPSGATVPTLENISESSSSSALDSGKDTEITEYSHVPRDSSHDDSDTGGEFQFEVVEMFFQRGLKLFNNADYFEAESLLKAGCDHVGKLTIEQKQVLAPPLRDVQLLRAKCAYHTQDLETAEAQLLGLTEQQSTVADQKAAIDVCEVTHVLSQVYLRMNRLDAARSCCKKALIGRRRVLGKEHESYYQSLWLLSEICEMDGLASEAKVYFDMIPTEYSSTLVKVKEYQSVIQDPPPVNSSYEHVSPVEIANDVFGPGNTLVLRTVNANQSLKSESMVPQTDIMQPKDVNASSVGNNGSDPKSRQLSSNNPFRKESAEHPSHIQRAQTTSHPRNQDTIPRSKTLPNPPIVAGYPPSLGQENVDLGWPLSLRHAAAVEPVCDWSLLWRFVAKLPLSALPSELRQQQSYITTRMLQSAQLQTLQSVVESFSGGATPFMSPLHAAVAINHKDLVRSLISNGYSVHNPCPYHKSCKSEKPSSSTPLHIAAEYDRIWMIDLLHEEGARFDVKDDYVGTPLHVAAAFGQIGALKELCKPSFDIEVDSKNSLDRTPLHEAALAGSTAVVQILLERGACIQSQDYKGQTPLHIAADHGFSETMEALLDWNANTEAISNTENYTPLHLAVLRGHTKVIDYLLDRGAKTEAKDTDARTALHMAISAGRLDVFRTLLGRGANVEAKTHNMMTPLHVSVVKGHMDMIRLLVERGAMLEERDQNLNTALHLATAKGIIEIINYLVSSGACVAATNIDGRSPSDLAKSRGRLTVAKILSQHSTDLKEEATRALLVKNIHYSAQRPRVAVDEHPLFSDQDTSKMLAIETQSDLEIVGGPLLSGQMLEEEVENWTPLHRAAYFGCKEDVYSLVNTGACVSKRDKNGSTACDLARFKGHLAIEAFLQGAETRSPLRTRMSKLFTKGSKFRNVS